MKLARSAGISLNVFLAQLMQKRFARRRRVQHTPRRCEEQQASALAFHVHNALVCQRTQRTNAVRGIYLSMGGLLPKGRPYVALFSDLLKDLLGASLPEATCNAPCGTRHVRGTRRQTHWDGQEIAKCVLRGQRRSPGDSHSRHRPHYCGLAPPARTFRRRRNFAALLGLTPRQTSNRGLEAALRDWSIAR